MSSYVVWLFVSCLGQAVMSGAVQNSYSRSIANCDELYKVFEVCWIEALFFDRRLSRSRPVVMLSFKDV